MRDVRLVRLSEDGSHLVLAHEGTGEQFALRLEDRVRSAVLSDRAHSGQLPLEVASRLSPKEIQARLRTGESTADIATAAGVPLERVLRYAGPVLAEREHIAGRARQSALRRRAGDGAGGPGLALDEAVGIRLQSEGVPADTATWDAWRADDGRWTVAVRYRTAGEDGVERTGLFTFDPSGRSVAPSNDVAHWLADGTAPPPDQAGQTGKAADRRTGEAQTTGRPAAEATAAPPRFRLTAVPPVRSEAGAGVDAEGGAVAAERSADPGAEDQEDTVDLTRRELARTGSDEAVAGTPQAPRPRSGRRRSRRAAVPSWDEILFGRGTEH